MATVRPQLDVHDSSFKPLCALSLLICIPLGAASMLWDNVAEGPKCIPSLCLKYLVICIANALLATGWLLVSVLSVLGGTLPTLLEVPPTLPRLPSRQESRGESGSPARSVRNATAMTTEMGRSYEREAGGEIFAARTVVGSTQTVKRSDSHLHRVRFAGGDEPGPVASSSRIPVASPPQTPERHSEDLPQEAELSLTSPSSSKAPLPSPPLSNGSNESSVGPRGRKLTFIRRRFADKHGRSVSSPSSTLLTPPSSAATSPARSPERPESATLQRSSTTPHPVKAKQRSGDASTPKHALVPRTDPYQAPYFFPSPLSPEAPGYVCRVRTERGSCSPEQTRSKLSPPGSQPATLPMLPTPSPSPEQVAHLDLSPDAKAPEAAPEPLTNGATPSRNNSKRRSWHIPLPRQSRQLDRPTSWASDAPTVGSSSGESSRVGASPRPKLSSFFKRSGHTQLAPLSPLQSTVGIDDVTHLPRRKRSWHIFSQRSASESHPRAPSPGHNDGSSSRPKLSRK